MIRLGLKGKTYLILAAFLLGLSLVPICYGQGETKEIEQPVGGPEAQPPGQTEQPATEAPDRPTLNINYSVYSKYVWRGYELSKNSFVMFPSITVGYKGFYLNWWGDIDSNRADRPDDWQLWEQDYVAWYSNSWKKLNYTIGYINYHTMPSSTQEVWIALGLAIPLNPTFSFWRDIAHGDSYYYNLAVSHSFPIPKVRFGLCRDWSLDVGGWVSFLQTTHFFGATDDYNDFHDGNIWAGLKIPLSDVCSITPKLQYSFPLSDEANDNIKQASISGSDSQFVYGGIIFDYTF